MTKWYVYSWHRPDGRVFYIGKGLKRRALSLSPSRRSLHFNNIVKKYGADALSVEMIECASEDSAFRLEKEKIAEAKSRGMALANMTDGGEGASGKPMSPVARAAFALWHGAYDRLSSASQHRILEGLTRGRAKTAAWLRTPEGQAHIKRLSEIGKTALHREHTIVCGLCKDSVVTRSAKAKYCSRICEQRARRACVHLKRQRHRTDNKSGVPGVYRRGNKWVALGSEYEKLIYLGVSTDWFEAVCLRKSWEVDHQPKRRRRKSRYEAVNGSVPRKAEVPVPAIAL